MNSDMPIITVTEVNAHSTTGDCWLIIEDSVFDLTSFASSHPGGSELITDHAGSDVTSDFKDVHEMAVIKQTLTEEQYAKAYKGQINRQTLPENGTVAKKRSGGTSSSSSLLDVSIGVGQFCAFCALISFCEPALSQPMLYVAGTSAALSLAAYACGVRLCPDDKLAMRWVRSFKSQYGSPPGGTRSLCRSGNTEELSRRCAASQVAKLDYVGSLRELVTSPLTRNADTGNAKRLFRAIVGWETFIAGNADVLRPYTYRGFLYRNAIYPGLGEPIVNIPRDLLPATWASATSVIGDVGICTFLTQLHHQLTSDEATSDWALIIVVLIGLWQQLYLDSANGYPNGCSAYYPITAKNPAFAAILSGENITISTFAPNMLWYVFAHQIAEGDSSSERKPSEWDSYFDLVSPPSLDKVSSFMDKRRLGLSAPYLAISGVKREKADLTCDEIHRRLVNLATSLSDNPDLSAYRHSAGYHTRMREVIETVIKAGGNDADQLVCEMRPLVSDQGVQKSLRSLMAHIIGDQQPTVVIPPRLSQITEYVEMLDNANCKGGICDGNEE